MTVNVMFCCNDSRNGNFAGMLAQLSVDDLIQVEGPVGDPEDYDDLDGVPFSRSTTERSLTIDGQTFKLESDWSSWVGNWCWDAAHMSTGELARLLNFLRDSGKWTCTEAVTDLFGLWEKQLPFTGFDFEHQLRKVGG